MIEVSAGENASLQVSRKGPGAVRRLYLWGARATAILLLSLLVGACQGSGAGQTTSSTKNAPNSEPVAPESEVLASAVWKVGSRYIFDLTSVTRVAIGGVGATIEYDLTASLEVLAEAGDSDGRVLYLAMPDARLHLRGADGEGQELESELRAVGWLVMLRSGKLQEIRVPPGVSVPASTTLRQIGSGLQIGEGATRKLPYSIEEYDTTGKYLAEYTPDQAGTVAKRKIRYLALLGEPRSVDGKVVAAVPSIVKSLGRIWMTRDGCLEKLQLDEELLIEGMQTPIRSASNLSIVLKGVLQGVAANGGSEREGWVRIAGSDPIASQPMAGAMNRARMRGLSYDAILSGLQKSSKKDPDRQDPTEGDDAREARTKGEQERKAQSEYFIALSATFREKPKLVADAMHRIRAKSPLSPVLISALASASTPEAQEALVALRKDAGKDRELDLRLLQALARLSKPGDAAVAVMESILKTEPYNQKALLALGTYARRFRDDGQEAKFVELGTLLVEKLKGARGPMSTMTALRAIGNSGYQPALPFVKPLISSKDERIRGAALGALRLMRDPEIDDILAQKIETEPERDVRISAIESARMRTPTDRLVAASLVASYCPDPYVRYRAVELLAKWLPLRDGLRPTLEKISGGDAEPRIRELARGAL